MKSFQEMLNSPLPSTIAKKEAAVNESTMDELDKEINSLMMESDLFGVGTMDKPSDNHYKPEPPEHDLGGTDAAPKGTAEEHVDMSDVEGDTTNEPDDDIDDDFDVTDMSDAELAELDKALGGDTVDRIANSDEPAEDGQVTLTPSEEMDADDMMSVAATSELIRDELNADEKENFLKTESEVRTAIAEGFLTEADVNELAMEEGLVNVNEAYTNKMIIRLSRDAKKKQLYALALNVCAAAHHDPDYVKYKKAMRLKKLYRAKFERKYRAEATKRMKIYFQRLSSSKSTVLSNLGKKVGAK